MPSKRMYFWACVREGALWYASFTCSILRLDELLPCALECVNSLRFLEEFPEGFFSP